MKWDQRLPDTLSIVLVWKDYQFWSRLRYSYSTIPSHALHLVMSIIIMYAAGFGFWSWTSINPPMVSVKRDERQFLMRCHSSYWFAFLVVSSLNDHLLIFF